jgi:exodeoxyribonuclease V alpha subunit
MGSLPYTFHNAENGFCVLRTKARGHRDLVTVVGHAATIAAGEWMTASGGWINDRTHGQQFKARFLRTSMPTSVDGIERYLSSGMIRGIGPVYAKKLVRIFGEKVFDVIEAEAAGLRDLVVIPESHPRLLLYYNSQERFARNTQLSPDITSISVQSGTLRRPWRRSCRRCGSRRPLLIRRSG